MPEAFKIFSEMIASETEDEKKELEQTIASKNKSISLIEANLNRKLTKVFGNDFNEQKRENLLKKLEEQKISIEQELKQLFEKKTQLVKLYKEQYDAEEKRELHDIEYFVQKLESDILQK